VTVTLHASTVAIDGRAVMIEGPSGAGKSDLALRLIDRGAVLVSDDYTIIAARDGELWASAPATIAGRIEVRGIGIVDLPAAPPTPVALIVRLGDDVPRLPDPRRRMVEGVGIAEIVLQPFAASTPIRIELAMRKGLPA
jgi:serine kinase of HPr protein (carbohydrate metabolism regulator)